MIYLGLRRNAGIDRHGFRLKTGLELDALCGDALRRQRELGFIEDNGAAIRLTREGRFVADRVVMDFL